jgi:hypothetical protein
MEQWVISPDLAGQKDVVLGEVDGVLLRADFPAPPDDYAWVLAGTPEKPELIGIRNFWLRAYLSTPLDTHPSIDDQRQPTEEEIAEAIRLYDIATAAAEKVLTNFLDMAAARHKRFLGRPASGLERQARLEGTQARLYIGEPPKVAKVGQPMRTRAFVHQANTPALATADVAEISAAITAGQPPDLAWQLYGRAHRLFVLEQDHRQAILDAAIAVEVAIDGTYRRVGKGQPHIELLIKYVRLEDQLKAGAAAVFGKSYADVDPKAHEQIKELLKERNDIVHEGASGQLEAADLSKKLSAVQALLTWLDLQA